MPQVDTQAELEKWIKLMMMMKNNQKPPIPVIARKYRIRKVQKTVNFEIKMHIRKENVQKTIKKQDKNAYIVQKRVKKDAKNGEKCIYSRNNGQKRIKKEQKNMQKRIYGGNLWPTSHTFRR